MRLKGIHLTEKARENPYNLLLKLNIYKLFRPQLQISTSFHKLNDLTEEGSRYKYVIFSPVFKSISKEDYKPAYKLGTIFNVLNNNSNIKVIALGGIEADNISVCYENLFKGVALSGYLWDSADPVEQFDKAKEICDQYKNKL
jgi:thiamine-phosphate pyrophosphorylase